MTTKTYLLIDLQNRRPAPEWVASWMGEHGEAWIFFGEQEVGALAQYLVLGDRVSLVDISKPGKNSLDFHLVLYLGYLVGRHEPGANFLIVAADGDYDPAIMHARSKGQKVTRVEELRPAPTEGDIGIGLQAGNGPRPAKPLEHHASIAGASGAAHPATAATRKIKTVELIVSEILKDLVEAGKPRTLTALQNRIQWRFGPNPMPGNVAHVLSELVKAGAIRIDDGKLQYIGHWIPSGVPGTDTPTSPGSL